MKRGCGLSLGRAQVNIPGIRSPPPSDSLVPGVWRGLGSWMRRALCVFEPRGADGPDKVFGNSTGGELIGVGKRPLADANRGLVGFQVVPAPPPRAGTRLVMTARFRPRGLLGIAYWYSVLPPHGIVFRGMLRGLVRATSSENAQAV